MLIGYARVSTQDQTLNLQQDALKQAGCDPIFTDTASGSLSERKGLEQAISHLREGDTLVVWRLDRLGRSLRHLIDTITALDARGIGFRSTTENIDTTTSGGNWCSTSSALWPNLSGISSGNAPKQVCKLCRGFLRGYLFL